MSTLATTPTSPLRAIRLIAADIKLAHSVFALPFALLAAFMAATAQPMDWPRFAGQLSLVVLAMVFARTAAMLANRIFDRVIDRANPRTAGRALPSGRLSLRQAVHALNLCTAGFLAVCAGFGFIYGNWWPLYLAAPVLVWICAYPLLKRFTSLCHLWLGASLAMSPLAAAIAIEPGAVVEQPALWLVSAMVLCWVAGFDIIYALQDVDIDRAQGLHSLPSRLGVSGAMWVSRGLHGSAVACLGGVLWLDPRLSALFCGGILIVAALLAYEHLTVARWGTSRIALAFLTLNGVISCVLGALGIIDLLVA